MKRLGIVAMALALVVGVVVGGVVGNPFDGTATAAPPEKVTKVREQNLDAKGNIKVGPLDEAGNLKVSVVTMPPSGSGGACYTNWNSAECYEGFTAVSTGVWTVFLVQHAISTGWNGGAGVICAEAKEVDTMTRLLESVTGSGGAHTVPAAGEPCAICCK